MTIDLKSFYVPLRFGLLACLSALSACNVASTNAPTICEQPYVPFAALIYPENGATNVPDTVSEIVIATQTLSKNEGITLSTQTATEPAGALMPAPSPLPSPHGVPPTPPPEATGTPLPWNYYSTSVRGLESSTTYNVNVTIPVSGTGPCVGPSSNFIGSFTTQ